MKMVGRWLVIWQMEVVGGIEGVSQVEYRRVDSRSRLFADDRVVVIGHDFETERVKMARIESATGTAMGAPFPLEAGVEADIGIEPCDSVALLSAEGGEVTGYEDFCVHLHRQRAGVAIGKRMKTGVEASIGIQPWDVTSILPAEAAESTA